MPIPIMRQSWEIRHSLYFPNSLQNVKESGHQTNIHFSKSWNLNPSFLHKTYLYLLKLSLLFILSTLYLFSWHSITLKGNGEVKVMFSKRPELCGAPAAQWIHQSLSLHNPQAKLGSWEFELGHQDSRGMWQERIRKPTHQQLTQFWSIAALFQHAVMTK